MRQDRKPLVAAKFRKLPLLYAPHEEPVGVTAHKQAEKGELRAAVSRCGWGGGGPRAGGGLRPPRPGGRPRARRCAPAERGRGGPPGPRPTTKPAWPARRAASPPPVFAGA